MYISDLMSETFSAITRNKGRTILTILGIVIGIASVVTMVSIGASSKKSVEDSIKAMGSNNLRISFQKSDNSITPGFRKIDTELLETIKGVKDIFLYSQTFGNVQYNNKTSYPQIYSIYSNLQSGLKIVIKNGGRTINENDIKFYNKVAIIGTNTAKELFGKTNPINKYVKINGQNFQVIGIIDNKKTSMSFGDYSYMMLIPETTAQRYISGAKASNQMWINLKDNADIDKTRDLVKKTLTATKRFPMGMYGMEPFYITTSKDMMGTSGQISDTFTILLSSIAGISLLVGGIGIMNMMLTTVTERTREIGLRKAIGAKRKDINNQFLAEAVALTFIGGCIGVFVGWVVSLLITKFGGVATSVSGSSILLAFGVSALIGIVFGYYPANRASKLSPIEALKYE